MRASGTIGEQRLQLRLARLGGIKRDGQAAVDGFFSIDASGTALELGRVIDLRIELPPQDDVIAVPVQAVYENGRMYRVQTDPEGIDRLEALDIEMVGETARGGDYRLLVRAPDLDQGDRIIVTQLPRPMTGLRVTPAGTRIAGTPSAHPGIGSGNG